MSDPLQAAAATPIDLRRAASRFATGVALVTAPGGLALVIDSFISASLEPPLVAFAPSRTSLTWRGMRRTGRFGVSFLDATHAAGIRERARPGADRLAGLDVDLLDGVPVVRDALAALVCAIEAEHPAGDHSIVLGHVLAIRHGDDRPPLIFFNGGFSTIETTRNGGLADQTASPAIATAAQAAIEITAGRGRERVAPVHDLSRMTP